MNKFLALLAAFVCLAGTAQGQSTINNLYQLKDVKDARSASDGESLVWSAVDNRWIPQLIGGGGGSQTPWASNINGANFNLTQVGLLSAATVTINNSGSIFQSVTDATLGNHYTIRTNYTTESPGIGGLYINTGSPIAPVIGDFDSQSDRAQIVISGLTDWRINARGTNEGGHTGVFDMQVFDAGVFLRAWQLSPLSANGNYYLRFVTGPNVNIADNEADAIGGVANAAYYDLTRDGGLESHGRTPYTEYYDTDAAAGGKRLRFFSSGTSSGIQLGNDDYSVTSLPLLITRSGTTVSSIALAGTATTVSGTLAVAGDLAVNGDDITSDGSALTITATATAIGNGATSSGVLRINEDTDAGSEYASFQVPSLAANTVYVLPADDGDAGEQLQTDGAGNLTWEAAGSGGGGSVATDAIFDAAGDIVQGTGANTSARLAIGTAGQLLQVNAGATAAEWTSAISVTSATATTAAVGTLEFEGATADAFETTIAVTDPTADRTVTLPNRTGSVMLSGDTVSSDITGTLENDGDTPLTIAANAVALGTDSTGNYVATIADSGASEVTVANSGTETAAVTLALAAGITRDTEVNYLTLDAGKFTATTTAGAASATTELTTLGAMQDTFDFDAGTDEHISAWFTLPDFYAGGDIAVTIIWTASTAGDASDDVIWNAGLRSFANDAARDTATTFDDAVTDTLLATGDEHVTSPMTGVTIQGTTPTAGQRVVIKIKRDADNASDNYGGDAKLTGVRIDF